MTRLTQEAAKVGLRINTEKSKSMTVALVGPMGCLTVSNTPLEGVKERRHRSRHSQQDWKSLCGLSPAAADMIIIDHFHQRQISTV